MTIECERESVRDRERDALQNSAPLSLINFYPSEENIHLCAKLNLNLDNEIESFKNRYDGKSKNFQYEFKRWLGNSVEYRQNKKNKFQSQEKKSYHPSFQQFSTNGETLKKMEEKKMIEEKEIKLRSELTKKIKNIFYPHEKFSSVNLQKKLSEKFNLFLHNTRKFYPSMSEIEYLTEVNKYSPENIIEALNEKIATEGKQCNEESQKSTFHLSEPCMEIKTTKIQTEQGLI